MDTIYYGFTSTPIGRFLMLGSGPTLRGLYLDQHQRTPALSKSGALPDEGRLDGTREQLEEYFTGRRTKFDLVLQPVGTEFQLAVWSALQEIPYGQTTSYGLIAQRIGRPRAVRAVGLANGQNPISIVIPCHRVIGSDGRLTGYGWGLERKSWLLDHESAR
ncbi:MAG: methylated-DNA--[protein]-cysteine S-methyltransferase [Candidatus Dormibacteraceae bacterium]